MDPRRVQAGARPQPPAWPWPEPWPDRPLVAGIVNVTPDSFSDGGRFLRWDKAVEHGLRLAAEGADLLDVGGESSRPGAQPVPLDEELRRVLPVVTALAGEVDVPIAVDTRHAVVAQQALAAGARWVNDISALGDPDMAGVIASAGAGVVLMHMQGEPTSMQKDPHYDDVVSEVCAFLRERIAVARAVGIAADRIWVDPGIGFGKTTAHNLALLRALPAIASLQQPVMLGVSRKRFIGEITDAEVEDRLAGSLAAAGCALAVPRAIVRVHDVRETVAHFAMLRALRMH